MITFQQILFPVGLLRAMLRRCARRKNHGQ